MDITTLTLPQILVILVVILGISFFAIKHLIIYSHNLQKMLKDIEANNVDKTFSSLTDRLDRDIRDLNKDINGLGSNLRGFRSSMEGFQNNITQVGLNHEKLSLRLQQIEMFVAGFEKRVVEIIHLEEHKK